ncbi:gfo/Idh/MocA family oxidoreductase, partial [Streptomyces sp. NPDC059466]
GSRPPRELGWPVRAPRAGGGAAPAGGWGVSRAVPHRVDVVVDLGGEERKPYVYAESVRAVMTDLVRCAGTGGTPVADARAGVSAVAVAEAATTSTVSGRAQRVVTGGERSRTA